MLFLFSKNFIQRLLILLINYQNQEMEKFFGRAMPYLKAITTAGFLDSPEVINATFKTYQNSCKKATWHQEIVLPALDATSITSCKDVILAFRDNKEIFVGLFRHAEGL